MPGWKFSVSALLILAAFGLAPAVSAQSTSDRAPPPRNTTPYPASFKAGFMSGCTEGGEIPTPLCACMFRNIERRLTLAEFRQMEPQMSDPNSRMRALTRELGRACMKNVNY